MAIHRLTQRKVATATTGKYENGEGLRLIVSNLGAKKWVLRFTLNGKRWEMGLGSFPDIDLAKSRSRAPPDPLPCQDHGATWGMTTY